jgi:hypothetical protein
MRAVLLVTKDKKLISKVEIAANPFVVGRAPDCSLSKQWWRKRTLETGK